MYTDLGRPGGYICGCGRPSNLVLSVWYRDMLLCRLERLFFDTVLVMRHERLAIVIYHTGLGDTSVISECSLGVNLVIDNFIDVSSDTLPLYKI